MDPKEPVGIIGMETDFICQIAGENTNAKANAAFIVTACNSHASLLAQVKELRQALSLCHREMMVAYPNGLPIQQGTLCEEQAWDYAVRSAVAALEKGGGE